MPKSKKAAALLALLLAFVMLFSVLYIALEAHHDCSGDGCAVCAQIHACEKLIQQLALAAALLLVITRVFPAAPAAAPEAPLTCRAHTLTALKVKLSD